MGRARIGRGVIAAATLAALALSFPLGALAQSTAPSPGDRSDWLPVMPAPRPHTAQPSPAPYAPREAQDDAPARFQTADRPDLRPEAPPPSAPAIPYAAAPVRQPGPKAAEPASRPDAQAKAVLFGAAYAKSDLSTTRGGGMMFLPGRGLIRWETAGKSADEQEELKTEAIGLADARAVQAQIDAQKAAMEFERQRANEAMAEHARMGFVADARSVPALSLNSVTGTRRQAGGVVPLNRAAQVANMLGVTDGARLKNRERVYLFGAVSGRGVGMNLMHDPQAGWKNVGLTSDRGGFVGQRQAGIALRRGSTQAAVSYVQEKTRARILGITAIKDHRAMINLTITPKFGN